MSFTIKTEEEYVPTTIQNEDGEQPIKFVLRYLNSIEREGLINFQFENDKSIVKPDYSRACRLGIRRIENFTVNGKAIVAADEFLKLPGFYSLFMEVAARIIMMNPLQREDDLKNSP